MKLLLDENLPTRLRSLLVGHDVYTVTFLRWKGARNGALLRRAADDGFAALLTLDQGIEFEQNLATLPLAIVVLHAASNQLADLRPLVPTLLVTLGNLSPRSVVHVR